MKNLKLLLPILLLLLLIKPAKAHNHKVFIPLVYTVHDKAIPVNGQLVYKHSKKPLVIRGSHVGLDLFEYGYDGWRVIQYGVLIYNGNHNTIVVRPPLRPLSQFVDLVHEANQTGIHVIVQGPSIEHVTALKHLDVTWYTSHCESIKYHDRESPIMTHSRSNCGHLFTTDSMDTAVDAKHWPQIGVYVNDLHPNWCSQIIGNGLEGSLWDVDGADTNWLWIENTGILPLCP